MIYDSLLKVSAAQAVTASAVSTNTIDLSQAKDIGEGEAITMMFSVDEAPLTATSVEFQVISSAAANLGTATVLGSSGAIAIASLPIGTLIPVKINARVGSLGQRYLGANYTIAGSNATAGKFTAGIVKDIQDGKKFYASGFSVT